MAYSSMNAEDVANIRENIRRLEEIIFLREEKVRFRGDLERGSHGFFNKDAFDREEQDYLEAKKKLNNLKDKLFNYDFKNTFQSNDSINVGSHFSVLFDDSDIEEEFVVVNHLDGISSLDGYISADSPFAQSVLGKSVGDVFSYKIKKSKIQGIVKKIHTVNVAHFLLEDVPSIENIRMQNELPSSLIVTPSQLGLLRDYEIKLKRKMFSLDMKIYLFYLREIMHNSCIVSENSSVDGEMNKKIGYGTSFSIEIRKEDKISNKRLEMILSAFSTETTKDYMMRSSTLGQYVYGLEENSSFRVDELGISGVVYDVDNTPYEDRIITNDPVVYQKRRM